MVDTGVGALVAAAFSVDAASLLVCGRGSNPARHGAAIVASERFAYRVDNLSEANAEVKLQTEAMPTPLSNMVQASLDPSVLLEWKRILGEFFRDHASPSVVNVVDVKEAAADSVITKMQRAECTVAEELQANPSLLRSALLDWLTTLAHIESTLGLTYVDVHLGNFARFEPSDSSTKPLRKLIDLESLQPLRFSFEEEDESDDDAWMAQSCPTVPPAYVSFLRGYGEASHRVSIQTFFIDLFAHKLERGMVLELRETYLALAQKVKHCPHELEQVEYFISNVVEPSIAELKARTLRPDKFYSTLLRRASGPNGLLAPAVPDDECAISYRVAHNLNRFVRNIHPGDAGKCLVIALCVAFLSCVVLHRVGRMDSFSHAYLEDGFCTSNKEQLLGSSHAISFYADVLTALGMRALVGTGRTRGLSEAALRPIAKNSLSLLGHGVGHLFLAIRTSRGSMASFEDLSPAMRLASFAAFIPVWYAFMKDRTRSVAATLGFTLLHNALQTFLLPTRFFFTHVLLAVLVGSAQRWLRRPRTDKTRYYAMEAWLVDVPIALAAFGEALTCESFLAHVGGHVWFDMVVPVGFAIYLLILVNDPSELWTSALIVSQPAVECASSLPVLSQRQLSLKHKEAGGNMHRVNEATLTLRVPIPMKRQVSGG